jgi:hypothetical protein
MRFFTIRFYVIYLNRLLKAWLETNSENAVNKRSANLTITYYNSIARKRFSKSRRFLVYLQNDE